MTLKEARERIASVFGQVDDGEKSVLLEQVIEDQVAHPYLKPAVCVNRLRGRLDRIAEERGWTQPLKGATNDLPNEAQDRPEG